MESDNFISLTDKPKTHKEGNTKSQKSFILSERKSKLLELSY